MKWRGPTITFERGPYSWEILRYELEGSDDYVGVGDDGNLGDVNLVERENAESGDYINISEDLLGI